MKVADFLCRLHCQDLILCGSTLNLLTLSDNLQGRPLRRYPVTNAQAENQLTSTGPFPLRPDLCVSGRGERRQTSVTERRVPLKLRAGSLPSVCFFPSGMLRAGHQNLLSC